MNRKLVNNLYNSRRLPGSGTYLALIVTIFLLLTSCRKFTEVPEPKDQVVSSAAFASDAAALSTISGLYSQMMATDYLLCNGGITLFTGLSSDELINRVSSANDNAFFQNAIPPTNELVLNTRLWSTAYKSIYHANAILEGLEKSTGVSPSLKQQLGGEARFMRAFFYFYLVNLFGDVPLVTTTDYVRNSTMARTLASEVYAQIITDLSEATATLANDYPSSGRLRVNKGAATALLARTFLYTKDWSRAAEAATATISSGQYELEANLASVFTPTSNETIWQLFPVAGSKTPTEAQAFLPAESATARPLYLLTAAAVGSFDSADKRRQQWVKSKVVSGSPNYYSNKYKVKVPSGAEPSEYSIVLRLAEQYLIRAEARAGLGDLPGAFDDLNAIRSRAGLPSLSVSNKAALLQALEAERRVEFLAEWGHRWLDLKRWQRADAVLGVAKAPHWQPTDALYPLPQTELKRNPFLTQNPGY